MTRERLGKLEKIILIVLKVSDEADIAWYDKYMHGRKPPYPHKLRDTWGIGDYAGTIIEKGLKTNVEEFLKKQMGIDDSFEKILKPEYRPCPYFNKSTPTERTSRYGRQISMDVAPFNAAFSRSLKSLISKGYIEAIKTMGGKQIDLIKLTEKGLKVKFHNWNLTLRKYSNKS